MIRKISGKSKSASYKHLNTNFNNTEAKATSKQDTADTLGSTSIFAYVIDQKVCELSKDISNSI